MFELIFFLIPIIGFIAPVVVVSIIIAFIIKSVKNSKNTTEGDFKPTISNANDPNDYWNSMSSESTYNKCEYCGSKYLRSKGSCPGCGAKSNDDNK